MNWGKKILIVYLLFVAGILFMVVKSSMQKTDLVADDYYARELKYQDKIDEMGRVNALKQEVVCSITGSTLTITFPKDFAGKKLQGEAILYCPSDEKKDIKQVFNVQDSPLQMNIPAERKGLFELQLSWQESGVTYYFEKKIII